MRVYIETETEEEFEKTYCQKLKISVDNDLVFEVFDGCDEDNTLSRNFADCFKIKAMMKAAYEAGTRQEGIFFYDV